MSPFWRLELARGCVADKFFGKFVDPMIKAVNGTWTGILRRKWKKETLNLRS
jgi:hypothetical protein